MFGYKDCKECIDCGRLYDAAIFYSCPACCEHKPDFNEGGHCEYCGAEPDWGRMIDKAKDDTGCDI